MLRLTLRPAPPSVATLAWLINWFGAAGIAPRPVRAPVCVSPRLMVEAAMQGAGIALAPALMFDREISTGRLVRPFDVEVHAGSYWLTCLKGKPMTPAMLLFSQWIIDEAARHATN
jgi:LysR family transcriptional regulator of beta-lactamase